MNLFAEGDGNTLLSPDEQLDLIPDLTSKEELNEWERLNLAALEPPVDDTSTEPQTTEADAELAEAA